MRKILVVAAALFLMAAAFARPAAAVEFQGQLLDGRIMRAVVFGPFGMQPATVYFSVDRARVTLANGEMIVMHVRDSEIMDPSFISAIGLDGFAYRIQLNPTEAALGGSIFDESVGPRGLKGNF